MNKSTRIVGVLLFVSLLTFSAMLYDSKANLLDKEYIEVLALKNSRSSLTLQLIGGKIIEDYPEYCIASVPKTSLSIINKSLKIILLHNLDYVYVPNYPFSYKNGQNIPPELMSKDTKLLIVKFRYSPKPEWIKHLETYGKIIGYISYNSVLIKAERDIPELPHVCFVGKFHAAYKIDPEILVDKDRTVAKVLLLKDLSKDIYRYLITNGIRCSFVEGLYFDYIIGEMPYSVVLMLSKSDSVIYIQKKHSFSILNNLARGIVQAGVLSAVQPIWDQGIRGNGQIIGEADTGIDYDHAMFRDTKSPKFDDPKIYSLNNLPPPDLSHRKIVHYWTFVDNVDLDYSGHGTHVAGSIAGNATPYSSTAAVYDGQAPSAKISFVDIGGPNDSLSLPDDLNYLFYWQYHDGARISSNSWGSSYNGYSIESMQVDQFSWYNPNFLILFANGNSGPNAGTVGSPATAKNCIGVGALGRTTPLSQTLNDIARFSSRGPTADGRIKPTIVSPGVRIDSADSDGNPNSNNAGIIAMDGTSMATPHAAGAAALIREYFMSGYYPYGRRGESYSFVPSAALLMAMMVNSADQATGTGSSNNPYNGMNFPNNDQGFGRIHLNTAMYFEGESRKVVVYDYGLSGRGLRSGEVWETNINVANSAEPLKVTLVWIDYPSLPGTTKALLNDLDLIVISPTGTYYHGNVFSGNVGSATSVPNPSTYDRSNNIEEVWITNPPTGKWTIRVLAYSTFCAQPFAVVVTGGLENSKSIMFDKNIYGIESAKISVVDISASGSVNVQVKSDSDPQGKMITLYSIGRGIFEGVLNIGVDINVSDGDKIYAEYSSLRTHAYIDISAPKIDNITVKALDTSAFITINTSEPTNYTFRYGLSSSNLPFTISDTTYKTYHRILLYNLSPNTTYYFTIEVYDRVGQKKDSGLLSFTTQPLADILLVDDENNPPRFAEFWITSLDAAGWRYSIWYYSLQGRPSLNDMTKYRAIIWDTCDGYPPLDDADVNLLKQYLDGGGKILLVGQDIAWSAFDTNSPWYSTNVQNFLRNYMKINYVGDQVGNAPLRIIGVSGDPVGNGINDYLIDVIGGFYPEDISNNGGIVSINYNTNPAKPAVIRYSSATYMSIYVAFAFQDIQTEQTRNLLVDQALRWLLGMHPTVIVRYPNGGEVLSGSVNITWDCSDDGTITKCVIYYSDDGGRSWFYLGTTTGNYFVLDTLTLPNGDNYKIRVIVYDNSGLSHMDESDSTFSIRNTLQEVMISTSIYLILFVLLVILTLSNNDKKLKNNIK